jgi:phosphoribosylglycinamide formyltransferase-1
MRFAILVSGTGTNMAAILEAGRRGELGPAVPVVVISNVPGARALERAHALGVEALTIDHKAFDGRRAFEQELARALAERRVEAVALAGFMRVLTPEFLAAFPERVLNIHPSLLPAFPGTHAQRQALAHGVKVSGCTVHFVDHGTDTGAIVAQAAVEVRDDDDEARLTARILAEEHKLFPRAIRWLAEGRLERAGRKVRVRA